MSDHLLDQILDELADRVAHRLASNENGGAASAAGAELGRAREAWRLLTVAEVAELLGRSPRWVHAAVRDRGLPFVRLDGGGKMFDPDAVRAWARARSVPADGG